MTLVLSSPGIRSVAAAMLAPPDGWIAIGRFTD